MDNEWVVRAVLCVLMVGAGSALLWLARAAASGRLKRNHIAGMRLPSTMASDQAWLAAHVRAERPTHYAGVVSVASGLFALLPFPLPVPHVGVLIGCVAMLALVLYGALVGGRAAAAISPDKPDS
jgi:hypothetical protein